jgi:hypothetical protein
MIIMTLMLLYSCKKDKTTILGNNTNTNNPGNPVTSFPVNVLSTFSKQAPQKQFFTMDASIGKVLSGTKGCMFYFPPNALLDKNNMPVTGTVDIELREYMNKADMLFSGVTVTSGNQLLESGGMFYLMPSQNGEELHLKNGSGFAIKVPQTNQGSDVMDIWEGVPNKKDSLNKIDWVKKDSVKVEPQKDSSGQGKSFYNLQFNYFKFGFCNIDREFSKFKTLIKKFRIKLPKGCNDTNSSALLLFKNYNCCAWCYWIKAEDRISTGYSLPLGEIAKVLVYRKTGKGEDDLEFALKEFTFTDETEVEFTSLAKCTLKELEDMIKAL